VTITRDSYTGLDYADQRFYASTYGRFNTPDPVKNTSGSAGRPSDPGNWNMYAYPVHARRDGAGTKAAGSWHRGWGLFTRLRVGAGC
jgi:RHS repeat-associated protein